MSPKRALPRGSDVVCLDATILISYAKAGMLEWLERFFGEDVAALAYTSEWLFEYEIKKPAAAYPENEEIVRAAWLHKAKVKAEDNVYVQNLVDLWAEPGRNRGEAEVVALCSRYGWTAVLDDTKGRDAAGRAAEVGRPFPARHVWGATMLVAAAAENLIDLGTAWEVHQAVERRYDTPPVLPTAPEYKQAVEWAVTAIRNRRDQLGSPRWPRVLALGLDPIVKGCVSRRYRELH